MSRDYAHGGLTLGPLLESKAGSKSRVTGGFVSRLVVSPQRDRLLSIEHGGRASARASDELSWVVLRSLTDGSVLDEAALEPGTTGDDVAFFADGAAVVLADHSCSTRRCDERGASSVCVQTSCARRDLFALDNGALQPLGERYRAVCATTLLAEHPTLGHDLRPEPEPPSLREARRLLVASHRFHRAIARYRNAVLDVLLPPDTDDEASPF